MQRTVRDVIRLLNFITLKQKKLLLNIPRTARSLLNKLQHGWILVNKVQNMYYITNFPGLSNIIFLYLYLNLQYILWNTWSIDDYNYKTSFVPSLYEGCTFKVCSINYVSWFKYMYFFESSHCQSPDSIPEQFKWEMWRTDIIGVLRFPPPISLHQWPYS